MEQDMVKGFAPHAGRPDEDLQVFYDGRLAGEFLDGTRPDRVLELRIAPGLSIFLWLQIGVGHDVKLRQRDGCG